ncbi:MAG: LutC/YkgG family protein [Burkholderiaceae bacterium]
MANSAAKERILSRIRDAMGRQGPASDDQRQAAQAYLDRHPSGPLPAVDPAERLGRFEQQSAKLSATTERLASRSQLPQAVRQYLDFNGLERRAIAWNAFADLDWAAAGLQVEHRAPVRDEPQPDLVGITGCFAAIAETGTLAMTSGPETPAAMTLLPETHIAVVPASRLVGHMEEVFALLRTELGQPPRALNFISGPSRTADIEQTLVLGAHGPYRVHIILLEND